MKVNVVLGLQWGDEGKGKIVDVLTPAYAVIARFQGGPNAGHSLEFDDKKFVLHTIPSGIFHDKVTNIIGSGVVIDPVILVEETKQLKQLGVPVYERLLIAKRAHLILPTHRIIDAASEAAKGNTKIGSTLKGIGPAYMDKTGRNGLRIGDILSPAFMERYELLKLKHLEFLKQFDFAYNVADYEKQWLQSIEEIKKFPLIESEYVINEALSRSQKILAEGAQGSLLDVDFGSYPFVTSSNTVCAGACTGLGIAPGKIGEVFGIFKAYCTRVGSGPFPTELNDETGERLRRTGHEFGATTGRARRTGWLDLVALKYAVMISGVTQLFMTKADVLDTFDAIKVAVAYKINGKETQQLTFETNEPITPVYKEFKGWKRPITAIRNEDELPFDLMNYVRFIEKETGVPVKIISVGPKREQTIIR
ncbi:MAG: adenylosuccinate synthase [Prevotellaceae bacterium]|jgi:adenylosuccinate synthase|nr:adenylosuccinate synthase [Prevotellaceae bacterium]